MNTPSLMLLQRLATTLALVLMWLFSFPAHGQIQPGKDYIELVPPPSAGTHQRIEVLEFFWYGCPHCNRFNPVISGWAARLPQQVDFRRVPAVLDDAWVPLARLYYALDALGQLPKLHHAVFAAIHADREDLADRRTITEWLDRHGIDNQKFFGVYSSPETQQKVDAARRLAQDYQIRRVPTVVIDGRFAASPTVAGGSDGLIRTLDYLVERSIKERSSVAR